MLAGIISNSAIGEQVAPEGQVESEIGPVAGDISAPAGFKNVPALEDWPVPSLPPATTVQDRVMAGLVLAG